MALPATAYQYYLYKTEPVFRMRADTKTLSAPLMSYLLGYVCLWLYWYSRPYPQAAPLRQRLARAVMLVGAGM